MRTGDLEDALADYIAILDRCATATTRTEDRSVYQGHLAAAAMMFVAIRQNDSESLQRLVDSERRGFGWGYLSGDEGAAAETAWTRFVDAVRSKGAG